MDTSTKDDPNENYAREVMQLFSIGTVLLNQDGTTQNDVNGPMPSYDQAVIDEFKRVYTGWFVDQVACPAPNGGDQCDDWVNPMSYDSDLHDTDAKTLFSGFPGGPVVLPAGQTGNAGPEPGDRRDLQPSERRALRRPRAHPQPRDLEPFARVRRTRRGLLQRRRHRHARQALAGRQGDPPRPRGAHGADRPGLRPPARARALHQQRAARVPRHVLRRLDAVRRQPRAVRPRHGPDDLEAADGVQLLPAGLRGPAGLGRGSRSRVRDHELADVAEARELRQPDDDLGRRRGGPGERHPERHRRSTSRSSSCSRRTPTTSWIV